MISNPTSKASIANGWANLYEGFGFVNRVASKVALVTGAGIGLKLSHQISASETHCL